MQTPEALPSWLHHHPRQWQADTLDRVALHASAHKLQEQTAFAEAAKQFACNMLHAFQSHRAVSQLMNQHGRFAFLAFVLALHHRRNPDNPASGVTYTRIKQLFAVHDLASPTRIKAMISLARARGLLCMIPCDDKRLRVLAPTEKMITPAAIWLRSALDASAILKPLSSLAAQRDRELCLVSAVLHYQVNAYTHSNFMLHENIPEARMLMSHEYGYLVLMSLLAEMQRDEAGNMVSTIPIGHFALRYAASRGAVRNLLHFAQAEGWLSLPAKGGHVVWLSAHFANTLERWAALEMEWISELARLAAAECNLPIM